MKPGNEVSYREILFECLSMIWSPGGEAARLQKELNIRSLEETAAAAERTGCTVCYVDLPKNVSGFAEIIEGQPHIVLNRAKSWKNLSYTLPHELGHRVLHLRPSRDTGQAKVPDMLPKEIQADLFAAVWVILLGDDRQRTEVLTENRESSIVIYTCLILTVFVVVAVTFISVCFKLFPEQRTVLPEEQ
jgi:IrrE N-terminal-like domain